MKLDIRNTTKCEIAQRRGCGESSIHRRAIDAAIPLYLGAGPSDSSAREFAYLTFSEANSAAGERSTLRVDNPRNTTLVENDESNLLLLGPWWSRPQQAGSWR